MDIRELPAEAFAELSEETGARWVPGSSAWHALGPPLETKCGRWAEDDGVGPAAVVASRDRVPVCSDCLSALEAARPDTAGELLVRQFRLFYTE